MKVFSLFTLLALSSVLYSQSSRLNNALKIKLSENNDSEIEYTLLVQGDIEKLISLQKNNNYRIHYCSGNIASIQCKAAEAVQLIENKVISYIELIPPHVQTMNDTMVQRNRIKPVKLGAVPLSQAYNGSGIIIGIIDTGIDFSHPDFKDAQGNSRILFLWDQVPISGSTVPIPFNYGIEWTNTQLTASLCTHSDLPYYGHGTHVAGIAAGNGLASNRHEGCAPKADIIVVALDFNKSGAITADAVQYIFNKASQLGKPCVINASVGDYYGSHDATDLEAKLIENMVKNTPGRVMIAAAGNRGNYPFHTKTQSNANDTLFTWLKNGANLDYWFYGDTGQVKNLQVTIGANRLNYSDLGTIGFKNYNYALTSVKHDTLKLNGNRIGIIHSSSSINNYGVYELYVQITADTTNLLWRVETKGAGMHHSWNFGFVANGLPNQSQYPKIVKYVKPDTMYTLVSSFQCSDEIITVGNYLNLSQYYDVNNSLQSSGGIGGTIAPNSSSGPTRDGRQKPDITASGNFIFSAMPMGMQAAQIAGSPTTVAQGSMHIRGGGTSAASPVVAGLAALYLQAHPSATNLQVKNAITTCAYSDNFTGTGLPSYLWGHGKLDGKAAMLCGENLVNVNSLNRSHSLNYYPNPFKTKMTILFDKEEEGKIYIYTSDGKLLLEDTFRGILYELRSEKLQDNNSGLLFVKINSKSSEYNFKLIKE